MRFIKTIYAGALALALCQVASAEQLAYWPHMHQYGKATTGGGAIRVLGGYPTVQIENQPATGRWQPGKPTYGNITFEPTMGGNAYMWDSMSDMDKFFATPVSGAFYSLDPVGGLYRSLIYRDLFPTTVQFPSARKRSVNEAKPMEPRMTLGSREGGRTVGAGQVTEILARTAPVPGMNQLPGEAWSVDQFVFEIDGMPGISVFGFTPEEIKTPAMRLQSDPWLPSIRITVPPTARQQGIQEWYDSFVGKGNADDLRTCRCIYTDGKGNPMVTVEMTCGILSINPDWYNPGLLQVEMFATKVTVKGWDPVKK